MANKKDNTIRSIAPQKSDAPKKQNESKGYGTVERCISQAPMRPKIQKKMN